MHDIIEFVNRHVPVPPSRRRIRVEIGQYVIFNGGIALIVERETRDGEPPRLMFRWRDAGGGEALIPADHQVFLGEHNGCRLVLRSITWRADLPIAGLLELHGEPRELLNAIEAAA